MAPFPVSSFCIMTEVHISASTLTTWQCHDDFELMIFLLPTWSSGFQDHRPGCPAWKPSCWPPSPSFLFPVLSVPWLNLILGTLPLHVFKVLRSILQWHWHDKAPSYEREENWWSLLLKYLIADNIQPFLHKLISLSLTSAASLWADNPGYQNLFSCVTMLSVISGCSVYIPPDSLTPFSNYWQNILLSEIQTPKHQVKYIQKPVLGINMQFRYVHGVKTKTAGLWNLKSEFHFRALWKLSPDITQKEPVNLTCCRCLAMLWMNFKAKY